MKVPSHIAIIMDGNGRWARRRGLDKIAGHRRGVESIRRIIKACKKSGVRLLTLYVFSTENWRRPKDEVNKLMGLLDEYLKKESSELHRDNIKLNYIGRMEGLPENVRRSLKEALELTKDNDGFTLNIALDYGGRAEIIDAAKRLISDASDGKIDPEGIDEELFSRYLYTAGLPDPDLVIRTSGEMRMSNFLLWQASYSEIYVTRKLWPDFGERDLKKAIAEFEKRQRRFGGH